MIKNILCILAAGPLFYALWLALSGFLAFYHSINHVLAAGF